MPSDEAAKVKQAKYRKGEKGRATTASWEAKHPGRCNARAKLRYEAFKALLHRFKRLKGCKLCGYNKSGYALDFHHLDPSIKKFGVTASEWGRSREAIKAETAKCVILCSNCHRRVSFGEVSLG